MSWLVSTTAWSIVPAILVESAWTLVCFQLITKKAINMSATKFAMTLGFVQSPILLMLTLKTNRSLDRMLETRKAWGLMSKASKTLTGLIMTYSSKDEEINTDITLLIARYLTLIGWSLKASFRKNEDDTDMIKVLFHNYPDEVEYLLTSPTRRPNAIVSRIRYLLSLLATMTNDIPSSVLLRMESVLYDIETTIWNLHASLCFSHPTNVHETYEQSIGAVHDYIASSLDRNRRFIGTCYCYCYICILCFSWN